MSVEVAVSMPCARWLAAVPAAEGLCRRAVEAALAAGGRRGGADEVSLVLADDATVAALNRDYRGKTGATNVLSFAGGGEAGSDAAACGAAPPVLLGDVVVAYETVAAEAAEGGKTMADHLAHLVVHGSLHLLGYDHEDAVGAAAMERLEIEALAAIGVADPYAQDEPLPA